MMHQVVFPFMPPIPLHHIRRVALIPGARQGPVIPIKSTPSTSRVLLADPVDLRFATRIIIPKRPMAFVTHLTQ